MIGSDITRWGKYKLRMHNVVVVEVPYNICPSSPKVPRKVIGQTEQPRTPQVPRSQASTCNAPQAKLKQHTCSGCGESKREEVQDTIAFPSTRTFKFEGLLC